MYRKKGKRIVDFVIALLGLCVLSIPMIIIALSIRIDSKGPVIFKQQRLGRNQKIFTIYKFRTMVVGSYEKGGIVRKSTDPRITRVGAVLRRTSLDELPQLLNILIGDMSIIGPRPILDWEFEQYKTNKTYIKRYNVLPGMFCTVDLNYRANAERSLQFQMDAAYSENITFIGDCKIFFGVIRSVVSGKNVYREE